MREQSELARRFEEQRPHLRALALRMLGSEADAEDAVQEAWLRLGRADAASIDNLGGWLTTVVGRVCLNVLRARRTRREESPATVRELGAPSTTADDVELADAVGLALLVVLERLAPAERVAFVLHDTFAIPFADIARILERSPEATRQLASRARRRVRDGMAAGADGERRRALIDAFFAASRGGDFEALLALLDPDAVLRADAAAVLMGAAAETRGAKDVATTFAGRAQFARAALVDGVVHAVWAAGGRARVVFAFTITDGRITGIDLIADAERLGRMDIARLG